MNELLSFEMILSEHVENDKNQTQELIINLLQLGFHRTWLSPVQKTSYQQPLFFPARNN